MIKHLIVMAAITCILGTPGPTPVPTPTPAVFLNLPPNASLPAESSCKTAADAANFPESMPANKNDNNQLFTSPSYFYSNIGGSQIGYSNSSFAKVDGNYSGSTEDILRWTSCKWGADESWVRAEACIESGWNQSCAALHGGTGCLAGGDCYHPSGSCLMTTPNLSFQGYPVTNSSGTFVGTNPPTPACASYGILQNKAFLAECPAWPMVAISTAWNADYRFAKYRACINGDSAKVGYFTSQNATSGADYKAALSRATSNPNSPVPSGQFGPTNILPSETNLQYLALGCMGTHFSGDWYGPQAICYLNNTGTSCSGFGGNSNFVAALNNHACVP